MEGRREGGRRGGCGEEVRQVRRMRQGDIFISEHDLLPFCSEGVAGQSPSPKRIAT